MVEVGYICDRCGHMHGTPEDNRSFQWCRRIIGTICGKCCSECKYCDEWHCKYDPLGREQMRKLAYACKEIERRISKNEAAVRNVSSQIVRENLIAANEKLKLEMTTKANEYEKLYAREGEEPELF